MNPHTLATVEERLAAWRAVDKAARDAEARVNQLGPGTADVALRDVARDLRAKADQLFASTLRAVELDEPM